MSRPIAIGLSPNTTSGDYMRALQTLFTPWNWGKQENIAKVEGWFTKQYNVSTAVSFNAGRSALLALLRSMPVTHKDEVLLQAFTCVAVVNSVRWAGLTPVFVDIDDSFNLDATDAERKITPRSRVLIVQHTFGIAADMTKIVTFCRKHKLLLIEDCAHSLGARFGDRLVGTFGDAAFFSFGRDKVISSVFGGVAITNNLEIAEKLRAFHESIPAPAWWWTLQQLLHPLFSAVILPTYKWQIGKMLLLLAQKFRLLSFPVYEQEKKGLQPDIFPGKYSNALASLALHQLNKLERMNKRRQQITRQYIKSLALQLPIITPQFSGAVFLRFAYLSSSAAQIRFQAKKTGIILGNWYSNVVDPKGTDLEAVGYKRGSCPQAQRAAGQILNLPTYPSLTTRDIDQIIALIRKNSI